MDLTNIKVDSKYSRPYYFGFYIISLYAIIFIGIDFFYLINDNLSRGQIFGRDFVQYWTASGLLQEKRFDDLYNLEIFNVILREIFPKIAAPHAFLYPPHGSFLFIPWNYMPYVEAYFGWCLVSLIIFSLSVGLPDLSAKRLLLCLLAPTTVLVFDYGQTGLLSGALFIGGMRMVDRHPILAGICIGLLSFKPHLGVLIPLALIVARLWVPFLSATVTVGLMVAWSFVYGGLEIWAAFFDGALATATGFLEQGTGYFMYMMPTPFMSGRLIGLDSSASYTAQAFFSLIALGAVIWSFYRGSDRSLQLATLATATALFSPKIYNYDMVLVLGAILLIVEKKAPKDLELLKKIAIISVWALPLFGIILNKNGVPLGPLPLFFLLILLVLWQKRGKISQVTL